MAQKILPTDAEKGTPPNPSPMHRMIYEALLGEIQDGTYKAGDRMPSEAILCERFTTSRITVAKAIHKLQSDGLVTRIAGSGTYVRAPVPSTALQFGLLIPDLGSTEIFEPVCRGMMKSPMAKSHSLIWGHSMPDEAGKPDAALQLCRQFIAQRVSGVFFAPIEFANGRERVNREIVSALARANIPVVLLDRSFEKYPDQAPYDLIGVDNPRAGYVMTRHLIRAGASRILFAARPNSASTVDGRIAGYREALHSAGRQPVDNAIFRGDFSDVDFVRTMVDEARPDGIVCANDATAAAMMQSLLKLGLTVPKDVRIIGMDDVSYAKFLPVPLTTLHQNCADMGAVAIATMLDRIQWPSAPLREVCLPCELVVRDSCGAKLNQK